MGWSRIVPSILMHPKVIHNPGVSKNESQNQPLRLWLVPLVYNVSIPKNVSQIIVGCKRFALARALRARPHISWKSLFGNETNCKRALATSQGAVFDLVYIRRLCTPSWCIKTLGMVLNHPIRSFSSWFKMNPISFICNKVQRNFHVRQNCASTFFNIFVTLRTHIARSECGTGAVEGALKQVCLTLLKHEIKIYS